MFQSIFQDQNGQPVKFFVQKDLPQEIQNELYKTITVSDHGCSAISCDAQIRSHILDTRGQSRIQGASSRLCPHPTWNSGRTASQELLGMRRQARTVFCAIYFR